MKIWLNELKEGDKFWFARLDSPMECIIIGDASNPDYKMPRLRIKSVETPELIFELFVNQYVWSTEDEAISEILERIIKKRIDAILQKQIIEDNIKLYDEIIEKYKDHGKQNNKENNSES